MAASLTAYGCNGHTSGVVVHVAHAAITEATVDHWARILAGGISPERGSPRFKELRQSAAEFLISSEWAIGEAAGRGLGASSREVQRHLEVKEARSFPGGGMELQSYMKAIGETIADLRREVETTLAASKLQRMVVRGAGTIDYAEVVSYYRRHRKFYMVPELREVRTTNRKTAAAAMAVRREVSEGKSFATLSETDTFAIARRSSRRRPPVERALATAEPHVLLGPIKQRVDYYVFEVVKIIRPTEIPLGKVGGEIARLLAEGRRRRALAAFNTLWTTRWIRLTDCRPGFVVPLCRQDRGSRDLTAFYLK